jgi:hypothetical protein
MIARAESEGRTGGGILDRIRDGASDLTDQVRSSAQAAKEYAVDAAGQLGEVVRDEAGRVIDAQRGKAASRIRRMSKAADTAARLLRAGRIEGVAKYVDLAAETAEHASDYVEERDFRSILEDLGEMAKQHPAAVFGGVLATAFAVGRLVKVLQEGEATDEDDQDEDEEDERPKGRNEASDEDESETDDEDEDEEAEDDEHDEDDDDAEDENDDEDEDEDDDE